jgi:chemotaxis signal transduction protein
VQMADPGLLVVWRLGGASLAARLDMVEEIVAVDADGQANGRGGPVDVVRPPGLEGTSPARFAVVVRRTPAGDDRVALAADAVDGVVNPGGEIRGRPFWLGTLDAPHLDGLVRLGDERVAAILNVPALFDDP